MATDVFISFDSRDNNQAVAVSEVLKGAGLSPWKFDEVDRVPGAYVPQLFEAVRESKIVVVVLTSRSLGNKKVQEEVDWAWALGKLLIPYFSEELTLDGTPLEYLVTQNPVLAYRYTIEESRRELTGMVSRGLAKISNESLERSGEIQFPRHDAMWDGRTFRRRLLGPNLPTILKRSAELFGRTGDLQRLAGGIAIGHLVPILGEPDSGKSALTKHFLTQPSTLDLLHERLESKWVSLLLLDCGKRIGPSSIFRELASAISKPHPDTEDCEPATLDDNVVDLLLQRLSDHVGDSRPLIIIENAHIVEGSHDLQLQLDQFMSAPCVLQGTILFLSRNRSLPDTAITNRHLSEPLRLGPIEPAPARDLIKSLVPEIGEEGLLDALSQYKDLLLPGLVVYACNRTMALKASPQEQVDGRAFGRLFEGAWLDYMNLEELRFIESPASADGRPNSDTLTLFCMALTPFVGVTNETITRTGLTLGRLPILRIQGLIYHGGDKLYLTAFARGAARMMLQKWLTVEPDSGTRSAIVSAVTRYLEESFKTLKDEDEVQLFRDDIEESLVWFHSCGISLPLFRDTLLKYVVSLSSEDSVPVLSANEATAFCQRVDQLDTPDLASMLAKLAIAVHNQGDESVYNSTVDTTARAVFANSLHATSLQVLDSNIFAASVRFRSHRGNYELRLQFVDHVHSALSDDACSTALLKWGISWILNTAHDAGAIGEWRVAASLCSQAAEHLISFYRRRDSSFRDWSWLQSRLCELEAMSAPDQLKAKVILRESTEITMLALELTPSDPRLLPRFFRLARLLFDRLDSDDERIASLGSIRGQLVRTLGPIEGWSIPRLAQLASFIRDIGAVTVDVDIRLRLAKDSVVPLKRHEREINELRLPSYRRSLLVQARCYALLASSYEERNEDELAIDNYNRAVNLLRQNLGIPTPEAWHLLLRVLREMSLNWGQENFGADDALHFFSSSDPVFNEELRKCQEWLRKLTSWNESASQLALFLLQTRGGIHSAISRNLKPHGGSFMHLTKPEKSRAITVEYRSRVDQLSFVERKVGLTFEQVRLRVWIEADYQRLRFLECHEEFDLKEVFSLFEKADSCWPDEPEVAAARARFCRYTWDFDGAVQQYRRALTLLAPGKKRHDVAIQCVEALIIASAYNQPVTSFSSIPQTRAEMMDEASRLFKDEVLNSRIVTRRVAILQDRLKQELGHPLNWSELDRVFSEIIGDSSSYLETIVDHISEIRKHPPKDIHALVDVVRRNCTDLGGLRAIGTIYLREAEKSEDQSRILESCWKAYGALDACRVLERSFYFNDNPVSIFLRGRAILRAVEVTRDPNPFPADLEKYASLAHLGMSRIESAAARTVGAFHDEVVKLQKRMGAILKSIE